jgi:hypothetical protein
MRSDIAPGASDATVEQARAVITLPPALPDLHLNAGRYRLALQSVDGHPFTLALDRGG